MPYIHFNEVWTPLKLIGMTIFKDEQGNIWYKFLSGRRKRIYRRASS